MGRRTTKADYQIFKGDRYYEGGNHLSQQIK